jgi:hypothetical protein
MILGENYFYLLEILCAFLPLLRKTDFHYQANSTFGE